jgi:protein phosphatase
MPWSAKALELVRQQYASVGTAARVGLAEAAGALQLAVARGIDVGALLVAINRPPSGPTKLLIVVMCHT